MVAHYSNLGSRYQNLLRRLPKIALQQDQEQKIVENLDDEILGLAKSWDNLQIQYQEYPEASNEIREMLENLNQALKDIELSYQHGEIDYSDVVEQMKTIQRRVRYYQVALDDEHALDASGREIRRR